VFYGRVPCAASVGLEKKTRQLLAVAVAFEKVFEIFDCVSKQYFFIFMIFRLDFRYSLWLVSPNLTFAQVRL